MSPRYPPDSSSAPSPDDNAPRSVLFSLYMRTVTLIVTIYAIRCMSHRKSTRCIWQIWHEKSYSRCISHQQSVLIRCTSHQKSVLIRCVSHQKSDLIRCVWYQKSNSCCISHQKYRIKMNSHAQYLTSKVILSLYITSKISWFAVHDIKRPSLCMKSKVKQLLHITSKCTGWRRLIGSLIL